MLHRCLPPNKSLPNNGIDLGFVFGGITNINMMKLFTRYKLMYHALFAVFPVCFVMPFYCMFVKYGITKKDKPLSFIGLSLGFYYFVFIFI